MKKAIILLAAAAVVLQALAGCSAPGRTGRLEVATELVKTYPVSTAPEDVTVKQLGAAGPSGYEYLGNLLVYDPGNAAVVPMDSAMFAARKAVSAAGGNYLYIMRLEAPGSLVRANYEIAGKILLATDETPLATASPLYEPMKEPRKRYTYMTTRDRSRFEGNSFYAEFGYGRVLNPLVIPADIEVRYGSVRDGWQWKAGYEYIIPGTPWGVGAYTSHFSSRYFVLVKGSDVTKNEEGTIDVRLHQVGPAASWNRILMKNWHLALRLGLGYGWEMKTYIPDSVDNPYGIYDNLYGVAQNFDAEFSYRFSRVISAGITLGESFTYAWGYDPQTNLRYSENFMVLTIGPILRFTF